MIVGEIEELESRVFLSAGLSGGILTIRGTDKSDTLTVSTNKTSLIVTLNKEKAKSFAIADVDRVVIRALAGNDQIQVDSDIPARIYGAGGNDVIESGNGDDSIWGDAGKDVLYGFSGDDRMFGGSGLDTLYGDAGRDGLFGGDGADALIGGKGIDRFLAQGGDKLRDYSSEDARVNFANVCAKWSDSEVAQMDFALESLVAYAGSARILRLSDGGDVTFERWASIGRDVLADNDSEGSIRIANACFNSPGDDPDLTAFHEMMHNWDEENPKWTEFKAISGWKRWGIHAPVPDGYKRSADTEEGWIYLASADKKFAYSYGKTNPLEDFATSAEEYYADSPHSRWQEKWQFIDDFFFNFADSV